MTAKQFWGASDTASLLAMMEAGRATSDIAEALRRSVESVHSKITRLRRRRANVARAQEDEEASIPSISQETLNIAQKELAHAELHPPTDPDVELQAMRERIRTLEEKNAKLASQLTWAQHAESESRTGGLLTLRRSDDHHGDKNHLLSCAQSLEAKFCVLVEQYEPEHIQIIAGDDWICGSGIYRQQDLDSATSDVNEQIAVGAVKSQRFLTKIRQVSAAPITWRVLRGNHEVAQGVSMAEALFYQMRTLAEDLADVAFVYHADNCTANLAAKGTYNILVRHGFGYSKNSPNSPAFLEAIKDEVLIKQREMDRCEHYRRVVSGHTHWLSVGLERLVGLDFDTTGGLQRNTRIRIGDNNRPVGWIVYVSPSGMEDEILRPIELTPDADTYHREIADPHLGGANLGDVQACLKEYKDLLVKSGVHAEPASFGKLNEGRY